MTQEKCSIAATQKKIVKGKTTTKEITNQFPKSNEKFACTAISIKQVLTEEEKNMKTEPI